MTLELTPVPGSLLADAKLALRITSTAYDDEITDLIAAAKDDLLISGVAAAVLDAADPDPLVKRAILVYCKAQFGMDNPDAERYMASFHSLVTHLALSAEYQQPAYSGITGSITAATAELTVSDATALTAEDTVSIAGAGADGALLITHITSIVEDTVTVADLASTTVTDAAVKVL